VLSGPVPAGLLAEFKRTLLRRLQARRRLLLAQTDFSILGLRGLPAELFHRCSDHRASGFHILRRSNVRPAKSIIEAANSSP